jgi:hypothetical protein
MKKNYTKRTNIKKKRTIKNKKRLTGGDGGNDCPICLEGMNENNSFALHPSESDYNKQHWVHKECAGVMLLRNEHYIECPLCRERVAKGYIYDNMTVAYKTREFIKINIKKLKDNLEIVTGGIQIVCLSLVIYKFFTHDHSRMYGSGKSIENDQNCEVVFIPQEGKKKSESIRKEEILKKLEILEKLEKLEKKYIDNFLNEYNKENKNISIHEFMNETIILSFESKNSNNKRKSNSKK